MEPYAKEFELCFWKARILHRANTESVYGLEIIDDLARDGRPISPGTIYPIFRRMEGYGWIRAKEGTRGKRRSFVITAEGRKVLLRLRKDLKALAQEITPSTGWRGPGID